MSGGAGTRCHHIGILIHGPSSESFASFPERSDFYSFLKKEPKNVIF
jgi:hypothetical protein